jgi:hypothetical protein
VRRRLVAFALTLLVAAGCGGGGHATDLTPIQRLHAAVKAAHAVWDPDSAGGTGYGTTAGLVRRMGSGTYGSPEAWPDDLAFRTGIVYVGTVNGGRLASLWTFENSGRALVTTVGAPHEKVKYAWQSPHVGTLLGRVIIRPGVLYPDMIRSALERAGFSQIGIDVWNGGEMRDGVRPRSDGGNALASSATGEVVGFTIFRTAADARKAMADGVLPAFTLKVRLRSTWIEYRHAAGAPDRSKAFLGAIAELRRELRTE